MTPVIPRRIARVYRAPMSSPHTRDNGHDALPLGQRLFDNMFVLLAAGLAVMLVLYTAWGMWEILSLPPATLP
jgi:hypothetical protein